MLRWHRSLTPDLASLDLNEIHKLARTGGASAAAIARRLGTTSNAIQAILLDHPAPADPVPLEYSIE